MSRAKRKGFNTSIYLSYEMDAQARKLAEITNTTRNAIIDRALAAYLKPFQTEDGSFNPVPAVRIENQASYAFRAASDKTTEIRVSPCYVLRAKMINEHPYYVIGEVDASSGQMQLLKVPVEEVVLLPFPTPDEWKTLRWEIITERGWDLSASDAECWTFLASHPDFTLKLRPLVGNSDAEPQR